ncbi:MAG: hypothetical protein Q4A65_03380, partial [Bacillota bacterium]|nr:hypothetical protein [Bacillota bacterium]
TVAYTPAFAAAEDSGDNMTSTKGQYWFGTHEYGTDLTDSYIYNEELLKGDSLEFNPQLATMTFELAIESISAERTTDYAVKNMNLKTYLEDNGFIDFDTNQDYKEQMTMETMGAACAHKTIEDNGKTYTLLALVPRCAGYEAEWGANFIMNESAEDTGDSAGFRHGKEKVLAFAKEYISKYDIKGDIKVWAPGYSRGAGVMNQVAAALINRPNEVLGDSINLEPGNLYCYTFGTPNTASTVNGTEGAYDDPKFNYIHNLLEPYDVVTAMPPAPLGFARYGQVYGYASEENKTRMLAFLQNTNPKIYEIYTTVGDPDNFKPKTIDLTAFITKGQLEIIDDNHSYLPDSQAQFMKHVEGAMAKAIGTRANYYESSQQDALSHLIGYIKSHAGAEESLAAAFKESRYTVPMVAFLYIDHMVDRYSNTTFDEETVAEINGAIERLEELIAELEESGEEVPEELKTELYQLKHTLNTASNWADIKILTNAITAILYTEIMTDGLTRAGLPEEDQELFDQITSIEEGKALTRLIGYVALYDTAQTDKVISFETVTQQVKHLATFAGNIGSFQRPHTNEVILSWLRSADPSYGDPVKANAAQNAGYRRIYIDQPEGVSVTGTVETDGKAVATFKDGKLTTRSDEWIGITTSDNGNWLRLPLDKTYQINLTVSDDTKLNLKATEYLLDDNEEVRVVTQDENYDWTSLDVKKTDQVKWIISAVEGEDYALPSEAKYYIEVEPAYQNIIVAKAISKGKKKIKVTWNKVQGADRYDIYFAKCNSGEDTYIADKVKSVTADKLTWTKTGLKKKHIYKFYVVAVQEVGGKDVVISRSALTHTIAGNVQGRFTNPKSLKLKKSSVTMAVGETFEIKATIKKVSKKKKLLHHTNHLRYCTDCPGVATVSGDGVITAVAPGTATIYVQTENGIWKTVKVEIS